jgi:hypothetical protein
MTGLTILGAMSNDELLDAANVEVYTGLHFVYTSDLHGDAYGNLRCLIKEKLNWPILNELSYRLVAKAIEVGKLDLSRPIAVLGPETLGIEIAKRGAAEYNLRHQDRQTIVGGGFLKHPTLEDVFIWERDASTIMRPGVQVIWVDDMRNTDKTWRLTSPLVEDQWPKAIKVAGTIADRSEGGSASLAGRPFVNLKRYLFNVQPEHCELCERGIPIVRHPGHGWEFEAKNPDYIGGYIDLPT